MSDKKGKVSKIKTKSLLQKSISAILMLLLFAILLFLILPSLLWVIVLSPKAVMEYDIANKMNTCFIAASDKEREELLNDLSESMAHIYAIDYIDKNGNKSASIGSTDFLKKSHLYIEVKGSKKDNGVIDFNLVDINGRNKENPELYLNKVLKEGMNDLSKNDVKINDIALEIPIKYWFTDDDHNNVIVYSKVDLFKYDVYQMLFIHLFIMFIYLVVICWAISHIFNALQDYRNTNRLYYTDLVSDGNNIQFFYDKATRILKRKRKKFPYYAIIDFGLDKYRNYCTCYGMEKGNELVKKINAEILKCIRKRELVAHADKADFALLLGYDTEEKLENRLKAIGETLKNIDSDWEARFHMGVYQVEPENFDVQSMFNFAGVALASCNDSNGAICYFTGLMKDDSIWVNTVESDMQRAIDNNEFQVYLQPKYSTKEEVLSGAEALVRWSHPVKGFIPPNRFVPIFEKNGFILKLDDYMISNVAKQQAKWLSEGKKLVPISVNVSRAHFTRDDLAEHICRLVDQYQVPHEFIELEVTESSFFDDKEVLISTVKKLKEYGFEISMDDFGAGYSSLNSLKEIPLDVLKLDAEFFRGNDDSGRGDIIVGEAINLAKKLDMRIVAEGIETREQVKSLAEKDCDLIQGYYFAKPMTIAQFEKRAYGDEDTLQVKIENDKFTLLEK